MCICTCRSEGPAQVFLLTLTWLIAAFGAKERDEWKKVTLAYDNMCHLDNLKIAKKELPLPGMCCACLHIVTD